MSRTALPFQTGDISAFARALAGQMAGLDRRPGHVELLNMLARAAGYRNFQHFRAGARPAPMEGNGDLAELAVAEPPPRRPDPVDTAKVRQLRRLFDDAGRLTLWPSKQSHQILCLWALWSMVPPRHPLTEREISRFLDSRHLFGDSALLRRSLCSFRMMTRTPDGREYRRLEQRPPAEALALIQSLGRPS